MAIARRQDLFLNVFEEVRRRYRFVVIGDIVLPGHFQPLGSEPNLRIYGAGGALKRMLSENRGSSLERLDCSETEELFSREAIDRVTCLGPENRESRGVQSSQAEIEKKPI